MNRAKFFNAIRGPMGPLASETVAGIEALLDAGSALDLHHMANVLAQVRRETGGGMAPIKETVMPWHKNKNPSDATVIGRLDRAFAKGQLKWVKTPYWRGGAFGRGQIQATHDYNYSKFGIVNYSDALKLDVSARIAVEGMRYGKFTGRKLSDYVFPRAIHNPPEINPRRIVNGKDGSDKEVAASHEMFAGALFDAGWDALSPAPLPMALPKGGSVNTPATPAPTPSFWAQFITAIFGRRK